jgi:arginine-specific protease argI polyprotein
MKTILWKKKNTIAVLTAFIAMFLPLKGYAEIVAYGLAIAGNKVTSANCNDLSILDGVSGKVCYDPTNKVLTLQDATINTGGNINAIYSKIDGITIKIIGTNNLKAQKAAITLMTPTTITGGGTLNAESEKDCGIFVFDTELTIDNCTINAKSKAYGIAGGDGTSEKLIIKNSSVTAEGNEGGSIRDLAELVLIGCNITQPVGATFDSSLHCVVLNGEMVNSKVVITKDPTAIATSSIHTVAAQNVYTINGIKLTNEYEKLSKGIYIVNGKKVIKQ